MELPLIEVGNFPSEMSLKVKNITILTFYFAMCLILPSFFSILCGTLNVININNIKIYLYYHHLLSI